MRLRLWAALTVALVSFSLSLPMNAACAKALVLRSTGPSASSYPPGLLLAEPLRIKLKAGDRLSILDAKGTRELRGPVTIDGAEPSKFPKRSPPSWEDLVGSKRRTEAAGVRDVPGQWRLAAQPPTKITTQTHLWQIDPRIGGIWCVADLRAIMFWREDFSEQVQLTISPREGKPVQAAWRKGESILSWPAILPAYDMAAYTMRLEAEPIANITLRRIEIGASLGGLARALSLNGCNQQLGILSRP